MHLTPTIPDHSKRFANLALNFRAKKLEEIAVEQSKPVPSQIKLTRLTIDATNYPAMTGGTPKQIAWAEEIRQNFTIFLAKRQSEDLRALRGGWDQFSQSAQASEARWWIELFERDEKEIGRDTRGCYIRLYAQVIELCDYYWF